MGDISKKDAVRCANFRKILEQQLADVEKSKAVFVRNMEDFKMIDQKLVDLPKKLEHKILAPICKVAYFDAKIIRTNEILLTISRENIVECTAHTARKIVGHRINVATEALKQHDASIKIYEDQLVLIGKMERGEPINGNEGEIEIKEDYDEEKELEFKKKREKRREDKLMKMKTVEKMQETIKKDVIYPEVQVKEKEKEEKVVEIKPEETEKTTSCNNDLDVQNLLDRLELQEKTNKELDSDDEESSVVVKDSDGSSDEEEVEKNKKNKKPKKKEDSDSDEEFSNEYHQRMLKMPGVKKEEYQRLIQYLNSQQSSSESDDVGETDSDEERDELDSDDEYPAKPQRMVQTRLKKIMEETEPEPEVVPEQNEPELTKPKRKSSIRFAETLEHTKIIEELPDKFEATSDDKPTISILKPTKPTPVDWNAIEAADRKTNGQRKIVPSSESAFPGLVVERDPMSSAMSAEIEKLEAQNSQPPQGKISKFKQARMKRN